MYLCISVSMYLCMYEFVCLPTPASARERVREATPRTRGVPDESHLQDAASNLEVGNVERRLQFVSRRSASDVWRSGLRAAGPIRP